MTPTDTRSGHHSPNRFPCSLRLNVDIREADEYRTGWMVLHDYRIAQGSTSPGRGPDRFEMAMMGGQWMARRDEGGFSLRRRQTLQVMVFNLLTLWTFGPVELGWNARC